MKRLILLSASIIMLLSACEKKEELAYVPSKFPTETKVEKDYSFKIPYKKSGNSLHGIVKILSTPLKGIFDTGCSIPIVISSLEFKQLIKNGAEISDKEGRTVVESQLADGSIVEDEVFTVRSVSITDTEGQEHVLKNVIMCVSSNVNSSVLFGLPLLQALGSSFEISDSESAILIRE